MKGTFTGRILTVVAAALTLCIVVQGARIANDANVNCNIINELRCRPDEASWIADPCYTVAVTAGYSSGAACLHVAAADEASSLDATLYPLTQSATTRSLDDDTLTDKPANSLRALTKVAIIQADWQVSALAPLWANQGQYFSLATVFDVGTNGIVGSNPVILPPLATLLQYDAVYFGNNVFWTDNLAVANLMADLVAAGKHIVVGHAVLQCNNFPFNSQLGRWDGPALSPVTCGGYQFNRKHLEIPDNYPASDAQLFVGLSQYLLLTPNAGVYTSYEFAARPGATVHANIVTGVGGTDRYPLVIRRGFVTVVNMAAVFTTGDPRMATLHRNVMAWVTGASDAPATSPNGTPCSANIDCTSGFCVDGVCCNSACGGGVSDDCQACAVSAGAAVNGQCGPRAGSPVCRAAAGPCDVAETCRADSTVCGADVKQAAGTACGGVWEVDPFCGAFHCDGVANECPATCACRPCQKAVFCVVCQTVGSCPAECNA